jgi:hypothetical protein
MKSIDRAKWCATSSDGVISNERMTYRCERNPHRPRPCWADARYGRWCRCSSAWASCSGSQRRPAARGSIDFDDEAEVIIDEGGMVKRSSLQRNVAHRLIEEFMLLANQTVASSNRKCAVAIACAKERCAEGKFEKFIFGFGYSLAAPLTFAPPFKTISGSEAEGKDRV